MPLQHRETVAEQGVEAVLLGVGESHVELLRPLGPDTAVGKFLERSGPGLHHVAYGTDDIDSALEACATPACALSTKSRGPESAAVAWHSCTRSRPAGCSPSWSSPWRITDG